MNTTPANIARARKQLADIEEEIWVCIQCLDKEGMRKLLAEKKRLEILLEEMKNA